MNKKIIIFLILIMSFLLTTEVKAETATFYEAEYISGIYLKRYNFNTKLTYYQQARFYRKTGSNEHAYCIEPFMPLIEGDIYESTINPSTLSNEQIDRITKLAYFGYGYKNHTEAKWFAVTQLMIWQTADPSGNFYFTDTLNGSAANLYLNEMAEINNLVNNYSIQPSFKNQTYYIVEDQNLVIKDENNVLNNYKTNDPSISINNNQLIIPSLKEGNYTFHLEKKESYYQKPYIFYLSQNSQNLMQTGNLNTITTNVKVNVTKTQIDITKIDKDTQSILPQGDASLDGAIFELYNEQNNLIQELEIINNQATIQNINFGTYTLKEKSPGKGYKENNQIYTITITKDTPKIQLIIENEVIKKKIIIHKKYGELSFQDEKNITFKIMNKQKDQIQTITTNEEGIAEITLPYGEYTIIQENSTEGYQKIDPLTIVIENEEDETIELKDLKIPVPNTYIVQKRRPLLTFLKYLLLIL